MCIMSEIKLQKKLSSKQAKILQQAFLRVKALLDWKCILFNSYTHHRYLLNLLKKTEMNAFKI